MKTTLFLIVLLTSVNIYSQSKSASEIFTEIQTYIHLNASSVSDKTDLRLNRFSKSIQLNSMDIPLNEVKIRYAEMDGMHVLIFECNNCITTLENNREKELAGFGWPFKSRDSCFKMIDMLADLKDALNRN
jgi:ATP-dependent helicase/DNAse subunit B